MNSAGVTVALAADAPARARREVRAALARLPEHPILVQHYYALNAEVLIDLYTGYGASAWRRVRDVLPRLNHSLILQRRLMKVQALHLQATAALAARRSFNAAAPSWRGKGSSIRSA